MGVFVVVGSADKHKRLDTFMASQDAVRISEAAWLVLAAGEKHEFFDALSSFAGQDSSVCMIAAKDTPAEFWARGNYRDDALQWLKKHTDGNH